MQRLTAQRVNGIKTGYWSAAKKDAQLSLFPRREPVREYKQRWSKEDDDDIG